MNKHWRILALGIVILAMACGGTEDDPDPDLYVDITIQARKADTDEYLIDADVVINAAVSGVLLKKTDQYGQAVFYDVNTGYRKVHVTIQGSDDDPYYGEWLNVDFSTQASRMFYVPRVGP